ncbi:MAG: CHAT domain-containing protein [Phenylobacterium sp.]
MAWRKPLQLDKWRLTWRYLIGWLTIFISHPVVAQTSNQWQLATVATVAPHTLQVLRFGQINQPMVIAVYADEQLLWQQNDPQQYLATEFVVLPSAPQSKHYRIMVKPQYHSQTPLLWQLSPVPNDQINAHSEVFTALNKVAKLAHLSHAGHSQLKLAMEAILTDLDDNHPLRAHCLLIYSQLLSDGEYYQQAVTMAQQGLLSARKLAGEQAKLYQRKGQIQYAQALLLNGQLPEAISAFGQALTSLAPSHQSGHWGFSVHQLLRSQLALSEMLDAFQQGKKANLDQYYRKIFAAIADTRQQSDFHLLGQLLNHQWSYFALKGDYQQAEKSLLLGLSYLSQSGSDDGAIELLNNLALTYRWQGQPGLALKYYRQALVLLEKTARHHTSANVHTNLANVYSDNGLYDTAKRFYLRAFSWFERQQQHYAQAAVLRGLGNVARAQGQYNQAIDSHRQSLALAQQISPEQTVRVLLDLSRDHMALAQWQEADQWIEQALASDAEVILAHERIDAMLLKLQIAWQQHNMTVFLALVARLQGQHQADLTPSHYLTLTPLLIQYALKNQDAKQLAVVTQNALATIDKVRQGLDTSRSGLMWRNKTATLISEYVAALIALANQSHDRQLGKQLQQQVFSVLALYQSQNLTKRRKQMAQQSNHHQSQPLQALFEQRLTTERAVVNAANHTERQQALKALDDATEAYLAYAPTPTNNLDAGNKPLSITQVQQNLAEDQLLLRYYVREQVSLVFAIGKIDWQVLSLPDATQLQQQVSMLRAQFKQQLLPLELLQQLNQLLPLDIINSQKPLKRLIVVQDGAVQGLPFAALNIAKNPQRYQPLITQYQLHTTYSTAAYFATPRGQTTHSNIDIAVFADPVFNQEALLSAPTTDDHQYRSWNQNLVRLPWTAKEADAISQTFSQANVAVLTGSKATNTALMSENIRNAKVLHIATHGYFNPKTPDIVGIATSVIDEQQRSQAGFLTLTELLSKPFGARLVVVSGCETTLGRSYNGEGFNGLTRGLLSQGAGAVIGTIWPIPDKPTALFMRVFYQQLKQQHGNTIAALNLTQRQFASQGRYRHPLYWAGFILTLSNREYADSGLFDSGS